MQTKILLLFLTVFLTAAIGIAAEFDSDSLLKPEGSMITSRGSTRPVIVSLSNITQSKQIRLAGEELHHEEEELIHKEKWNYRKPEFSSKHFLFEDRSDETVRPYSAEAAQAPIIKTAFSGIPNQGGTQPDCNIAVGPSSIMLAVNDSVGIYSKSGEEQFRTTFAEWFAPLTEQAGSSLFDPKLLYDKQTGHYIFLIDARRGDKRSWFLLSVSKTSDPRGDWALWALDMQLTGGKRDLFWADFPRIGLDENAIYVSGNMHEFGNLRFRYAKFRVLRKSQVYKFGNISWKEFSHLTDANNLKAIDIEPVLALSAAGSGYLVNTTVFSGNKLTLWIVSNPGSNDPTLQRKAIAVSPYQLPPNAQQKGGSVLLNTRDAGVYNAVLRDGSIYTAHNAAHDWGSGQVCAIRFYQIKTNGELVQEITYGKNGYSYFYPVVTVDSRNNVILGFNRSSGTTFAGVFFTGRKATDALGKFQNVGRLAPGRAYYSVIFHSTGVGRWGDYNGISLDADDFVFFFSEYANTNRNWETIVGQLKH